MSEELTMKAKIAAILKENGLDVAEDAAVGACKAVFASAIAIVTMTENKYDDMLIPVFGLAQPKLLEVLDKIDGKEG